MPGRSSSPRSVRLGVLAVVLAVLVAACGWWEDDEPTATTLPGEDPAQRERVSVADLGPFDLALDDLAGPGTPLGGGLAVPEGAALLGIPFPDADDGGFRALMVVTGDPVVTYNAMVSQALSMGMERDGVCLGGPQMITCGGRFVDGADGESLLIDVRRSTNTLAVASGLAVHYRQPGSEEVAEVEGSTSSASVSPTEPLAPVDLPPTIVPPPDGDVGLAVRPPDAPVRRVEVGTRLVGLAGPCACGAPGWSFVVAVEGRVRDIIAAYARQFTDLGDPPDVSDRYLGDQTTFHLVVGEEARRAEIRAVAPDDDTTYLMVTVVGA